jgi:cytosine/adenosine deaminase-related metal-dependent hydrolase
LPIQSSSFLRGRHGRRVAIAVLLAGFAACAVAQQQPAQSGAFTLHKFAKAIGKETYSIESKDKNSTLTSHFLFTDRGTKVPLETVFTFETAGLKPVSYTAKGQASRQSGMDDALTVNGGQISITRDGKSQSATPAGAWFITDGYSPVAMQEEMMRWWIAHAKPEQFTVLPSQASVHIEHGDTMIIDGHAVHGFTVSGLIWGQESLWIDDAQNLVALVSTDAEFDHFEAVREPYEADLGMFIAAAVRSNLAALAKLSDSARTAPAKLLAITGATLEDSTGAPAIADSVIVIKDGLIAAAGPRSAVKIPKGATVLDATGKYAIPGLWDMHAHYEQVEWGPIYLAAGVTSVRDVGNEFDFIHALHEELDRKQNPAIGPHLEFAGIIDGIGQYSLGAVTADTPEQAVALVAKYKAAGAKQIKIYSSVKPDVVKAISAAAHERGMTVTGHIPEGMTAIEGINDGMDQINHIQYEFPYFAHQPTGADGKLDRTKPPIVELDGPKAKELIAALQAHHTVLDPTMALFETFMNTVPLDQLEPGVDHVAPQLHEALDSPPAAADKAAVATAEWQALVSSLRTLHAAGIPIVAGTDQCIPGYSLHREMEIYVQAGFTPLEALQSATIVAARALGVEKESGSLEAGKRGDVLLLDADPLADIHNSRKVWRTVAAGAVYDPAPLWTSVGFKP